MWLLRLIGTLFGLWLLAVGISAITMRPAGQEVDPAARAATVVLCIALGLLVLRISNRRVRAFLRWIGRVLADWGAKLTARLPERVRTVRLRRIGVGIVLLLVIGTIAREMAANVRRERPLKAFYQSLVSRILRFDTTNTPKYARGRLLVIELPPGPPFPPPREKARVSSIHYRLNPPQRTLRVNEVGTVAEVICGESRVGSYSLPGTRPARGAPGAYRRWCEVHLIDVTAGLRFGDTTLYGSMPPRRGSGRSLGSRATPLVQRYLEQLPRRDGGSVSP